MNIGLLFGMIVAIVMMGLLLVFGFEQINNIGDIQTEAEFRRVTTLLKNAVDEVYNLGGESSKEFTLSLPSNIERVCFMPLFSVETTYQYGVQTIIREPYTENDLRYDLKDVISGMSSQEENNLVELLIEQSIIRDIDGSEKLEPEPALIFFTTTSVPQWFSIPHMGPSKDSDDILCVGPVSKLWFKRNFDSEGAWVDVEEA